MYNGGKREEREREASLSHDKQNHSGRKFLPITRLTKHRQKNILTIEIA